ncbi:helix-turn-helix domain-containing protein [Cohnella zeiphila]|uniref:helix-turn-helix domain-containing protein n=1 Tax=Cohnella zeiphila TaxID=2761120 RepID=UPI003080D92F
MLVVDDDYLVRRGFISMMPWKDHGLEVVGEAGNGRKALEFLQERPVDLVVTDLAMPVMTGIELMRQAKERFPDVHAVVLTFHQDFDLIQEALRLGALDYITKVELEDERMDDVLRRISRRLREAIAAKALRSEAAEEAVSMRKLQEVGERWAAPDWVTSDCAFREALEETARLRLSAAQTERLFYVAAERWKRLYGSRSVLESPPGGREWSEWERWLACVRADVRSFIDPQPYSAEVKASILRAVDYIKHGMQGELLLPEVAKRVHMSRSYFSRCFRDIVGKTFNEYVREVRVEHAKVLLRQTNKTIGWVATQSGYPNEKYFCKVFRELTGVLPSEYRKREKPVASL